VTTFLLIRHAATDWLGRALAGRTPGVGLNRAGREQAERLGRRLAAVRLDAIHSSPLERAVETAEAVARHHGLGVERSDRLLELDFGEWTGRSLAELEGDPRWAAFNAFRADTRIPSGDHMLDVQARVAAELETLRGRHPSGRVAVVSHGDVIRAALLLHAGIPLDGYGRLEVSPASVSVVEMGPSGSRVLRLNDTGTLEDLP
jgi:probable phosphoglycerate mutase